MCTETDGMAHKKAEAGSLVFDMHMFTWEDWNS